VIISDVMLPGLDGIALLRSLRQNGATRDVPVILVSARTGSEGLQALELGADDYIVKPFGGRELVARVRATVENSRLRGRSGEARGRAQESANQHRQLRALLDELKATQRRAAVAADAERRRIERDIHDGAQQRLTAIRLKLGVVVERLDGDPVATELERLHGDLDDALQELRELAHGLYPPLLASDGLGTALAAACRRAAVPVELESGDIGRLPPAIESAAYFCCMEALQNVDNHAGPGARARLRLGIRHGVLELEVRDDGAGFAEGAAQNGQGLANLRDRLVALGGDVAITSARGRGTVVSAHLPLP
jgi:signal transduction histidine kinase